MPHPDALKWNTRYSSDPHRSEQKRPHALLTSHLHLLPAPGLAVDMACGTSASGLFLAAHKWQVICLDVAESALRHAQVRARKDTLPISFAVMDLTYPWLPVSSFDAILNFYYLARPLWETYKKSLKPGGVLFFETYVWQPGIEMNPAHYLQPDELRQAFMDWEILHYHELNCPRSSDKLRQIAQLIVRAPI